MKNFRIEAIILAIGLLLLGVFIEKGFSKFAEKDRSVTVKGLAEIEVPANKVTWPLVYKSLGNDLGKLYDDIKRSNQTITDFLKEKGLTEQEISVNAPEAMLTVTIPADALTRLIISLETGDVRLAPMQLKTLNVALTNGGLRAEDLTVTRDLLVELPAGGCVIDHLSVAEYANITATRCIQLHLDGDPADYTTDARTDNVVRIGSKTYDKRYTSTGPNGILNLYARGLIDLNTER